MTSPRLACAMDAILARWSEADQASSRSASRPYHDDAADRDDDGTSDAALLAKLVALARRPVVPSDHGRQAHDLINGLLSVEVGRLVQVYRRLQTDDDDDDDDSNDVAPEEGNR